MGTEANEPWLWRRRCHVGSQGGSATAPHGTARKFSVALVVMRRGHGLLGPGRCRAISGPHRGDISRAPSLSEVFAHRSAVAARDRAVLAAELQSTVGGRRRAHKIVMREASLAPSTAPKARLSRATFDLWLRAASRELPNRVLTSRGLVFVRNFVFCVLCVCVLKTKKHGARGAAGAP